MKTVIKTIVAVMVITISFVALQSFKSIQKEDTRLKKEIPTQIIKYHLDDNKCGAGKCGDGKKDKDAKAEKKEGKCGEGKCGAGKCGDGKKDKDAKAEKKEGKCGDGKCGDGKKDKDAKAEKKADAKCGTGKCGDGK